MPSLLEHMETHLQDDEDRKYKCDECGRGYRHAGSLANHKKTHETGSFQCQICGKENSNTLALKSHLRSHTSQKKYACMDCGKAFRLASQLATHERVHLSKHVKEQAFRTVEDDCEESDPHEEEELFEPSVENSPEEDENGPPDHASDDPGDRPFRCDLCDKSYIHYRSLTNHKRTHQTGMFECPVCFKLFNNMAALYGHQRTHRGRGGDEPSASDGPYASPPPSHFSPHTQDSSLNFCHLCQVLFSTDEEFQEHIQMHNSSSGSYGAHGDPHDPHTVSYENSVHSPDSNFYASPVNNIPSVSSSAEHHGDYDHPEQILSNGQMFSDCSGGPTPAPMAPMGPQGPPLPEDNEEADEGPDSGERRFKCEVCGKRYRHSGSLINHRRSHQVGIYQCSICRKSYPHLAALKSHLRLHKAQPSSFSLSSEGDWLSSEPLTLEAHAGFPPQEGEGSDSDGVLAPEQEAAGDHGPSYQEAFSQGFPQGRTVHLPQDQHLMQRHQCADCGETFADIAGIKSHACPLHQGHEAGYSGGFGARNGERAAGHPEDPVDFPGVNGNHRDQSYFSEEAFHQHAGGEDADEDADEEDEEDGDLYQCSVCGNRYTSMRALRSHLRGHTQAHATPGSSGPSSMSSHEELKDEGDMMMMMICSTCGESFAKRQDLLAHQLSHNPPQAEVGPPHPLYADGADPAAEPQSSICGCCGLFCSSYQHLKNHGCGAGGKEEPSDGEDGAPGGRPPAPGGEQPPPRPGQGPADGGPADGGARQYKCEQCGRSYRHAGSLLNHKKSHKTGVFRCLVCQKRFYNLLALKNHQRSHFDVKRHACHERNGPQEAGPQRRLAQRGPNAARRRRPAARGPGGGVKAEGVAVAAASEGQGDLRPFSCDQCGRTYRHAGSLVNHKNSHKTGEYCLLGLQQHLPQPAGHEEPPAHTLRLQEALVSQLWEGLQGEEDAAEPRVRAGAGRKGSKAAGRSKPPPPSARTASRASPPPSSWPHTPATSPTTTGRGPAGPAPLKQERPFTCSVCNRSYRHAGSLLNHKNTHKTGHFSCSVCSKPFTNPMALRNHTRIHTQTKNCPQCGKGFQGRSGLKRHRCQRSQESTPRASGQDAAADKCFMCDLCGRSYRHAGLPPEPQKSHSEALHHCTIATWTSTPRTAPPSAARPSRASPARGATAPPRPRAPTSSRGYRAPPTPAATGTRAWTRAWTGSQAHPAASPPGAGGGGAGGGRRGEEHVCDHCGRTYRHAGSLLNHKNSHKTGAFFCAVCQKGVHQPDGAEEPPPHPHGGPSATSAWSAARRSACPPSSSATAASTPKRSPSPACSADKSFSSKSNLRHHQKMHQNAQAYEAFSMDANSFRDLDMASFL
ncbi:unnamed protein product [Gadus morhua 'NCC']